MAFNKNGTLYGTATEEQLVPQWTAVDDYHASFFKHTDPALEHALQTSEQNNLPNIMVPRAQAKTLQIFLRALKPKLVVEIGTLGGYSTIWLARALPPGGKLITLEKDEGYAELARQNLAKAGLSDVVQVKTGSALESLNSLAEEGTLKEVDFWFIDADKENNKNYVQFALDGNHSHPGSIIVVDNVVRGGKVIDFENGNDSKTLGVRELNKAVGEWEKEGKVSATSLQTVGEKAYDGMCFLFVGKNLE